MKPLVQNLSLLLFLVVHAGQACASERPFAMSYLDSYSKMRADRRGFAAYDQGLVSHYEEYLKLLLDRLAIPRLQNQLSAILRSSSDPHSALVAFRHASEVLHLHIPNPLEREFYLEKLAESLSASDLPLQRAAFWMTAFAYLAGQDGLALPPRESFKIEQAFWDHSEPLQVLEQYRQALSALPKNPYLHENILLPLRDLHLELKLPVLTDELAQTLLKNQAAAETKGLPAPTPKISPVQKTPELKTETALHKKVALIGLVGAVGSGLALRFLPRGACARAFSWFKRPGPQLRPFESSPAPSDTDSFSFDEISEFDSTLKQNPE